MDNELRRINGLDDELNKKLMAEFRGSRSEEIREALRPYISQLRTDMENAQNSAYMESFKDRAIDKVGNQLKIAVDSGGTDAGAGHRQVMLEILSELLTKE